jgi:hypothetical protein
VRKTRDIGIAKLLSDVVVDKAMEIDSMDLHVAVDGARVAAWLVWKFKSQLHRAGAFDLHIDESEATPTYVRVAIEKLRRSKAWIVTTQSMNGRRRYRVRWLGWGEHAR